MRAIRGADLDQLAAGACHHVGHAERAADLDQFATRNDDFAPVGQAVQRQQNRCRIVVDDQGVFRAGHAAQRNGDVVIPLATAATVQVIFDVAGSSRVADGIDCLESQRRATEIGVKNRACQVEHAPQRGGGALLQQRQRAQLDLLRGSIPIGRPR